MKNILITTNKLSLIFEQLQLELGGRIEIKSNEYQLTIDNGIAKGKIIGISVENAIAYIEYDIIFKQDLSIVEKINNANLIHFGYCCNGAVTKNFGESGIKHILSQFQTGIFSSASKTATYLNFKKNKKVKLSVITVDILSVFDQDLKRQLQQTFLSSSDDYEFSYFGSLNLKILEKVAYLNTICQKGLVRNLLTNSTIYHLLALEIEQYKEDLENAESSLNLLSQSDFEAVKEISNYVKNNPEIQYSLKFLSKKSGLSPLKLQEGFKIMHDRTVTDFIRNVRVEVAENLIRTSELNISEIVYSIGLTSRSYFSKIFKAKYNCCPKQYQNNILINS